MRQSLFAPESSASEVAPLSTETADQISRLILYALIAGGAALIVAVVALIVALLR